MKTSIILIIIFLSSTIFCQTKDWLTLGIVRTDGIIIPTFRYENNQWESICGEINKFRSYEGNLDKWFFVPFSSDPYYIYVGSLVHFDPDNEISEGYGYISDYVRKDLQRFYFPIKKVGVALNKDYPISIFRQVTDSTQLWRNLFNLVSARPIKINNSMIMNYEEKKEFLENIKMNFDIFSVKSTSVSTNSYYYFEATKFFSQNNKHFVFYYSGWIVNNNSNIILIEEFMGIADEDFKTLSDKPITPLSIIEIEKSLYFFYINSAWEGENYGLSKISENEIEEILLISR